MTSAKRAHQKLAVWLTQTALTVSDAAGERK